MRWAWLFLLSGCGTDTFTSVDGSASDGSSSDGTTTITDAAADNRDGPPACQWCPHPFPTNKDLFGVSGSNSSNSVVVVGTGVANFWNGTNWTPITVAGGTSSLNFKAVAMTDTKNVWAAGNDGAGAILFTGDTAMFGLPTPSIGTKPAGYFAVSRRLLIGIVAGLPIGPNTIAYQVSANGPWFYGDGTVTYYGLDAEGAGSAVAVGNGKVSFFNGATWVEQTVAGTHYAVSGNSNNAWIAGAKGEIIHYSGMNGFQMVTSNTSADLKGITVRGGDVYAVGTGGVVVYIKGGNAPAVATPTGAPDLNAIWSDNNGIWAVGNNGAVIRHL